jgi:hypothetical protein
MRLHKKVGWTEAAGGLQDDPRCAAFVAQLLLLPKGRAARFRGAGLKVANPNGSYYRTTSEFSIDAGLVTAPIGVGLPT